MDLDGDGFLDLVTINDGEILNEQSARTGASTCSATTASGRFRDATDALVAAGPEHRRGRQRRGVPRLRLGRRRGLRDRLAQRSRSPADQRRQGTPDASRRMSSTARPRRARSAWRSRDLDGDGRIDVVQAQGEHPTAVAGARLPRHRTHAGHGAAVDHDGEHVFAPRRGRPRHGPRARSRSQESRRRHEWKRVVVEWTSPHGRRPRRRCSGTASTSGARTCLRRSRRRRAIESARPTRPATRCAPVAVWQVIARHSMKD